MTERNVSFVASGQIPPSPPPAATTGVMGWLKENLFSGPVNSAVTVICIGLVLWFLPGVIQWAFVDGVWIASSLKECREINAAGACWAVIVERFDQFIYGFYPEELRWRPNLAFVLLLVALVPALFDNVPYRGLGLMFSALYPVVAYFLIWGGSVWGPLLLLAAPMVAYAAFVGIRRLIDGPFAAIGAFVAALLWLLFVVAPADGAITRAIGDSRFEGQIAELEAQIAGDVESGVRAEIAEEWAAIPTADERDSFLANAVEAKRSALTTELANLRPLPERRDRLAQFEAELAAMEDDIPSEYSGVGSRSELQNLDPPPPADVRRQLEDLFAKETQVLGAERQVDSTYQRLGLVGLTPVSSDQLGGFLLAMIIGVAGIVLSLPIGILLALGRQSGLIFIQSVSIMFIEFFRGVPLITLLFVANSVLAYFFPPNANLDLILRVVIMVTLFASAYMAEVIRGGLAALPPGQYEAADAMGLDYWKSMRLIVLPQALKISIPNIVSTFIGLFKDTTLVVVIGLLDPIGLINTTRADSAWNGIIWEFYVFVGLFFFIICFGMSRYSMYLERKLATDRR
ncbi:MAG: amino acid ABC transporter permease [Pseudomonadota bacterium]